MVELWIVVPAVAGSSPVSHPQIELRNSLVTPASFLFLLIIYIIKLNLLSRIQKMNSRTDIKSEHNPWVIFSVVAISTFMATLDSSIVNVALPVITRVLNTDINLAQWIVTGYLLTISSLLPIFGRAGDMYGQRRVLTAGMILFVLSSALCGMSASIWMLISSRILQAIGAAMMMSNGPAIIATTFPVNQRGRALGSIGTVVALGSVAGPSIGGILVGAFGWQSIFYINIPIGLAGFVMGRVLLPEGKRKDETFDFAGSFLFTLSISSILLVLSHGGSWGWSSFPVIAGSITGITSLILFIYTENVVRHPMLDLSLFRNWPFLAGNMSGLLSFMAMFSNAILLPFFLTRISNLSPSQVGLIITPFPLVMGVVAPVSGYLSERIKPVILTTLGLTITAAGLGTMSSVTAGTSIYHIAVVQAALGLGSGLFQSPNNNSVISSVIREKMGIAGGMNALMRNIGMVTGTAISVSIFENQRVGFLSGISAPTAIQMNDAFIHGFHYALLTGACIAAAGAFISLNRRGYAAAQ